MSKLLYIDPIDSGMNPNLMPNMKSGFAKTSPNKRTICDNFAIFVAQSFPWTLLEFSVWSGRLSLSKHCLLQVILSIVVDG